MANNFLGGESTNTFGPFIHTIEQPTPTIIGYPGYYDDVPGFFRIFSSYNINLGAIFYFTIVFTEYEAGTDPNTLPTNKVYYAIRKENMRVNYFITAPIYYYENNKLKTFTYGIPIVETISYERILESYVSYLSETHPSRMGMYIRGMSKRKYTLVDNNKTYKMSLFAVFGHSHVYQQDFPNPLWMKIADINTNYTGWEDVVKSALNSHSLVIDFTLPFETQVMDVIHKNIPGHISNLQIGHLMNRKYGVYIDLTSNLSSMPFKPSYNIRQ